MVQIVVLSNSLLSELKVQNSFLFVVHTRKIESFAEKGTRSPEEPNKHHLQSSSNNPTLQHPPCDYCQLTRGSSICRDCFKISCNDCQDIFVTELCPDVAKGGIKVPHCFLRLSSKRTSKSKSSDLNSRSYEPDPAGTPSSDDQQEGTGMKEWPWSCNECTYHNEEGAKVCEMCHKTLRRPDTYI